MNTFGAKLALTTFGESHGKAIGGILDGLPAGIKINLNFIQSELDRRKPGGKFATARKESDEIEILSGVFEGISTGCPIGLFIYNKDQKSKDYEDIKDIFRPGHADFTYMKKFDIRDYRGGGRSSARESAIRVGSGAIAQMMLDELGIEIQSGVYSVGMINANSKLDLSKADFNFALTSPVFSLFKEFEAEFEAEILQAKSSHDSIGASVVTIIKNTPAGLGEVLYDKFDARLAAAMMGINGIKAVEIGNGAQSSTKKGSRNNDMMDKNGFKTNNSGGILGGITNSDDIIIKIHFKPTPSIFLSQKTLNVNSDEVDCKLKGRHDPCIGIRGSVVATAMARLVVADMLLLNLSSKLDYIKKVYQK